MIMLRIMKRFWSTFVLALVASLLVGILFYLALMQHYPEWRTLHLFNTSLTGIMAMFSGVAAGLFVYSMRSFRKELRHAYAVLCVGIVLFGLAQVQFPLASYIDASFWYVDGFIGLPYLAAVLCIFLGVRSVARILDIGTRWASFRWLLGASIVIPFLVAILPHASSDLTTAQLIGTNALTAFDAVFLLFAVMTIIRIRQFIGPRYVHAMTWLAIACAANIAAGIHYIVVNLVTTSTFNWYFYDAMTAETFFVASVLLVYAGYTMVMVDRSKQLMHAHTIHTNRIVAPNGLPLVDIITYLASLASKPQEIDPTLDILRDVTSQLHSGQRLSKEDEKKLMDVYRAVENYLVKNEPLRIFTIQELNSRLVHEFNLNSKTAAEL